jgi:hypothetical protein
MVIVNGTAVTKDIKLLFDASINITKKSMLVNELAIAFKNLERKQKVDAFNIARFPKSNIHACAKEINLKKNKNHILLTKKKYQEQVPL